LQSIAGAVRNIAIWFDFIANISDIIAMKTIILTHAAAKDLDELPAAPRAAIADALHRYAMTGVGDVKRLQGRDGYRMRVGRYRVLFDEDQTTILAIYIGKRETTTYR
jgi:mRNA interferase RelE/StbE